MSDPMLAVVPTADLVQEVLSRAEVGGVVVLVGEAEAAKTFQQSKVSIEGKIPSNVWLGTKRSGDVKELKAKVLYFMHLAITRELHEYKKRFGEFPEQFKGMVEDGEPGEDD